MLCSFPGPDGRLEPISASSTLPKQGLRAERTRKTERPLTKEAPMLAIAGTGYGLIGILVIILLVVLILYFVRRA